MQTSLIKKKKFSICFTNCLELKKKAIKYSLEKNFFLRNKITFYRNKKKLMCDS